MTWRGLFSFFFSVSLFALFGSTFIISDVGAISDYTLTLSDNSISSAQLCGIAERSCSDYSWLIIESSSPISVPAGDYISYRIGLSNSNSEYKVSPVALPSYFYIHDLTWLNFTGLGFSVPSGTSITFTLTDSLPSSCPPAPSGDLAISENGTYDVSSYATATVFVDGEVIQGDYHDDLVSINNTILIGCAVPLVIYFFYGIYKMILGGLK